MDAQIILSPGIFQKSKFQNKKFVLSCARSAQYNCIELTEYNSEQIFYFEILIFEKFRDLNNLHVHR